MERKRHLTGKATSSGESRRSGDADPQVATTEPYLNARSLGLFAFVCGLSVANIYCAQPLLPAIGSDLAIAPASLGLIVTVAQIGYGLGLLLVVPLGDLIDRRRLIITQLTISGVALSLASRAPTAPVLFACIFVVGLMAVVIQVLVALTADLAAPAQQGRAVGAVTSGIVVGILLARFVAGFVADLGGWRAVYMTSAVLTFSMAGLLCRTLPRQKIQPGEASYLSLLLSVGSLFRRQPVLRIRACLALLTFATFSALWTSLALLLSAPPYAMSQTQSGLFALAGVAGALGAARAGRWADQGRGDSISGWALLLMSAAWVLIGSMNWSLWVLVAGIVALDFAVQAVHVTSQSMIFSVEPNSRSRAVAGYMVFYSVGSAGGAIASTAVYSVAGWLGVCGLGVGLSALALVFWTATRGLADGPNAAPKCPAEWRQRK